MSIVIHRSMGPWQRLGWAVGVAALVGALCLGVEPDPPQPVDPRRHDRLPQTGPMPSADQALPPSGMTVGVGAGPAQPKVTSRLDAPGPWPDPVEPFQADAQGALRISPATLRTLEQLLVRASGLPVATVALAHARTLPAAVQAQAVDLAERHERYDASLRQLLPAGHEAASVEALLADAQALHALRQQWFGEGVALQLFGPTEETTTQIQQWMAVQ